MLVIYFRIFLFIKINVNRVCLYESHTMGILYIIKILTIRRLILSYFHLKMAGKNENIKALSKISLK